MRECPYCKSNRVRMNGQRYAKNVWIAKRPLHKILKGFLNKISIKQY